MIAVESQLHAMVRRKAGSDHDAAPVQFAVQSPQSRRFHPQAGDLDMIANPFRMGFGNGRPADHSMATRQWSTRRRLRRAVMRSRWRQVTVDIQEVVR